MDDELVGQRPQDEDEGAAREDGDQGVHIRQEPQPVAHVHGHHHVLAVGEIDDVHDAPDQAEPESHQGVKHTVQQAVEENLEQCVHRKT
jgi:hypothetical protein